MIRTVRRAARLHGTISVPGDKSISHRAVLLNSIASGTGQVHNFLLAADCLSTVNCLRGLGVAIEISETPPAGGPTATVQGVGLEGLSEPENVLDAGNSGTTMRLLAGLLATQPFLSILTGDASLRSRPMGRVIKPLQLMGADIRGRLNDTLAPLAIRGGNLRGIDYRMPVASAQLKSALILAALRARGPSTITEPAVSRDHTERMLRTMGATIVSEGTRISVKPLQTDLKAQIFEVPGDVSSAAFWLVAALVHPDARVAVRGVDLNPTRTGIIDVLQSMGARLVVENAHEVGGERIADLTAESSELVATEVGGALIPRLIDEVPLLAVAACFARGTTVIRDAAELRVKESDRIATVSRELRKLGAEIEEQPDGMRITGPLELAGAACESYGDHRLAMALAIAGLVTKGETSIQHAEAVDVSYPEFWEHLEGLSMPSSVAR